MNRLPDNEFTHDMEYQKSMDEVAHREAIGKDIPLRGTVNSKDMPVALSKEEKTALRITALQNFSDKELVDELSRRGYIVTLTV